MRLATNGHGAASGWQHTACILCAQNCGIEVQTEAGRFTKIKGDKAHPGSKGYQCQKALQLDHYQNGAHRLTSPLRRRADGTFEEVSWDVAIQEVADKLVEIRDTHGGHTIAQFGGGGQGNHLGGLYASSLRAACDTRYLYTSLAQEKTGGFWVNGRLFGSQACLPIPDHHSCDFMMAIGWNPWQSHGMPRARKVLQDMSKSPDVTLVVVDPRRTESAERANIHLQVKPGGDAHMMLAMLGTIVQENLVDDTFLNERCAEYDSLLETLRAIPIDNYAAKAGLDPETVRDVARRLAAAKTAAIHTDLGLEHTIHSTLNQYLSKLLFLLTGNFGKPGTQNLIPFLMPIVGNSKDPEDGGRTARNTGAREIGKLYPPNALPDEMNADSPDRLRAVFVDSGNPAVTVADAQATRRGFENLDLLVVIDVAMTETARLAHYVFPASSQYEKWECTFFNFGFPDNVFHLRRPVFEPLENTLPEPEIYRRLVVAMGELPDSFPELEDAARKHWNDPSQGLFPMMLMEATQEHPELRKYSAVILYSTLGRALPDGAASAAVLWGAAQQFAAKYPHAVEAAGIQDTGAGLGEALFRALLSSPSGVVFSSVDADQTWSHVSTGDGRIHLEIPEMMEEIAELANEVDEDYPYILQAGERRDYNANQIFRSADWRKKDRDGAMKMHPDDAAPLELADGDRARVKSDRGEVEVSVWLTDEVRPGFLTLPHGYGMIDVASGEMNGPDINLLSDADRCDRIAKTPFHKYIPVQVAPVREAATVQGR